MNTPTGSGKTLAYLVPIMNRLLNLKENQSNQQRGAIIMVPTKELGVQVYRQIRLLDQEGRLNVSRTGSISYYSNII
jgi:superfamily II DNA/RNA helicase